MLHLGLKGLDRGSPEGIVRDALGRIRGPSNALREVHGAGGRGGGKRERSD